MTGADAGFVDRRVVADARCTEGSCRLGRGCPDQMGLGVDEFGSTSVASAVVCGLSSLASCSTSEEGFPVCSWRLFAHSLFGHRLVFHPPRGCSSISLCPM